MKINNIFYYVKTLVSLIAMFCLCGFLIYSKPCLAQSNYSNVEGEASFRIADFDFSNTTSLKTLLSSLFEMQGLILTYEESLEKKLEQLKTKFIAKGITGPEALRKVLKENGLNYKYLGGRTIQITQAYDEANIIDITLLEQIIIKASKEVKIFPGFKTPNESNNESNSFQNFNEKPYLPSKTPIKVSLSTLKENYRVGEKVNIAVLLESQPNLTIEEKVKTVYLRLNFNKKVLKIVDSRVFDQFHSINIQNKSEEILIELSFSTPKAITVMATNLIELNFLAIGLGEGQLNLSEVGLSDQAFNVIPLVLVNSFISIE